MPSGAARWTLAPPLPTAASGGAATAFDLGFSATRDPSSAVIDVGPRIVMGAGTTAGYEDGGKADSVINGGGANSTNCTAVKAAAAHAVSSHTLQRSVPGKAGVSSTSATAGRVRGVISVACDAALAAVAAEAQSAVAAEVVAAAGLVVASFQRPALQPAGLALGSHRRNTPQPGTHFAISPVYIPRIPLQMDSAAAKPNGSQLNPGGAAAAASAVPGCRPDDLPSESWQSSQHDSHHGGEGGQRQWMLPPPSPAWTLPQCAQRSQQHDQQRSQQHDQQRSQQHDQQRSQQQGQQHNQQQIQRHGQQHILQHGQQQSQQHSQRPVVVAGGSEAKAEVGAGHSNGLVAALQHAWVGVASRRAQRDSLGE